MTIVSLSRFYRLTTHRATKIPASSLPTGWETRKVGREIGGTRKWVFPDPSDRLCRLVCRCISECWRILETVPKAPNRQTDHVRRSETREFFSEFSEIDTIKAIKTGICNFFLISQIYNCIINLFIITLIYKLIILFLKYFNFEFLKFIIVSDFLLHYGRYS